jgi:DNA-directed RNA polymerase subunit beta'
MPENKDIKANSNFSKITIGLASPEEILQMSHGEVTKPETVNYRTYSPEKEGLFCEHIFGPTKDYECHCGKYKRIRYRGIVCDRCGVEVTEKKVRRERMGHIALTVPVAHIWYFHSSPNKIGNLLDIPSKNLEQVIYYERYILVQPGIINTLGITNPDPRSNGEWKQKSLVDEEYYIKITEKEKEIRDRKEKERKERVERGELSETMSAEELAQEQSDKIIMDMGAQAIYTLLSQLDLEKLSYDLRAQAQKETSQQRKSEALKRLNVIEAFRESGNINRPEWMILKIIPVIPPDLRPLVPLDGGRFATSDLNDLYRRVIIRNNRLKKLIEIKAPEVILRNEKRMLQEAVDSLFDNSRKSNAVKSESNRPLKSLSDSLKGKQGRFRQNLLGKRVDYSARSVIVVGPELKMHECGMPVDMAAELYKPFIIRKLIERGIVKTVKSAKRKVDDREPMVVEILENVIKGHPVFLNRAPTLHRLGIQAFQPKLIEGKAIQLHPLACTAFNADFDGDQMAIHLPLGNEAILEAQLLMLGSHNILNPANGAPITVPSQDMVLGIYYITKIEGITETGKAKSGSDKWDDITNGSVSFDKSLVSEDGKSLKSKFMFYGPEEAIIAYNQGRVGMHTLVDVRVRTIEHDKEGNDTVVYVIKHTSVGRVIFNQIVPAELPYINKLIKKKDLRDIIGIVMKKCGTPRTAAFLDDMKDLGYKECFRAGVSFNLGDVIVPDKKRDLISEADQSVDEIRNYYEEGLITENERYNKVIDVWTRTNNQLKSQVLKEIKSSEDGFNPIWMMLDSGARGSEEQVNQVCGMRGLMANPHASTEDTKDIIESPIRNNIKDGLSVQEYFISTHGARKGLTDTALKTADAGYLTRRLVDVSHDVIINEEDCGTLRGIVAEEIKNNGLVVETLKERILGRVPVHDIVDPNKSEDDPEKVILAAGKEITEEICDKIDKAGILQVEIRSVLTCESKKGVCAKCYGRNLATGHMVQKGEVVGVIAAQAIGEPGTQLTLRSFHAGGAALRQEGEGSILAPYEGIVYYADYATESPDDFSFIVTDAEREWTEITVVPDKAGIEADHLWIPNTPEITLMVSDGQKVQASKSMLTSSGVASGISPKVDGTIRIGKHVQCKQIIVTNGMANAEIHDSNDKNTLYKHEITRAAELFTLSRAALEKVKASNLDQDKKDAVLTFEKMLEKDENGNVKIRRGEIMARWDIYSKPILAETSGAILYDNLWNDSTYHRQADQTGHIDTVVDEPKEKNDVPSIWIVDTSKNQCISYPFGGKKAEFKKNNHDSVSAGDELAYSQIITESYGEIRTNASNVNEQGVQEKGIDLIKHYIVSAERTPMVKAGVEVGPEIALTDGENPIVTDIDGVIRIDEKADDRGIQYINVCKLYYHEIGNSDEGDILPAIMAGAKEKQEIEVAAGEAITNGTTPIFSEVDGTITEIESVTDIRYNERKGQYERYVVGYNIFVTIKKFPAPLKGRLLVKKHDEVKAGDHLFAGAVVSEVGGLVSKVEDQPDGTKELTIHCVGGNEVKYYILPHYDLLVKYKEMISEGQALTNGVVFPEIKGTITKIEKRNDGLIDFELRKFYHVPDLYKIKVANGEHVKTNDLIAEQKVDSDIDGTVVLGESSTYGLQITVLKDEAVLKKYTLPRDAVIMKANSEKDKTVDVSVGEIIAKIPRKTSKSSDITTGLPRVTELFEARNPSNPAIVSEISGEVSISEKLKRGNAEVIVTPTFGKEKKYLIPNQRLNVMNGDYVRAGTPLSDGDITPSDILAVEGPVAVQQYIVNQIQDVYRTAGVKINDKHFEIIVRQMMRKVQIIDSGDTNFLPEELVEKIEFNNVNDNIFDKKYVIDPADSATLGEDKAMHEGQIVSLRQLRDVNAILKRKNLKEVVTRNARTATAEQILQGITRAALRTNSFMSAASFQETTKVLSDAAIHGKTDNLEGLKENVICGHLIPAGTGQRAFDDLVVYSKEEYQRMLERGGEDEELEDEDDGRRPFNNN